MTDLPSEVLDATQLDQALLVLVVRRHGTAYMSVANDVDDPELADWITNVADRIRTGEHRGPCPDCAAGTPHAHGGDTETPD